jgi:hypothetical protein
VPARPLTATRRTALAVAAGLTGLAACTSDPADSPAGPGDAQTTSAPPVDADQELVTGIAVQLAVLGVEVDSIMQAFPALRGELRPLRRMHAAHLEALGGFDDPIPSPEPQTEGRSAAVQDLVLQEQHLQRELARDAVRAESGTLAKLLASMSAAVAQHLAALG